MDCTAAIKLQSRQTGVGLFQFDIVGRIFGGQAAIISRIIFTIVALAGIWCISLLFRHNEVLVEEGDK